MDRTREERPEVFTEKKKIMLDREVERIKWQAKETLLDKWKEHLLSYDAGEWTYTLIQNLDAWMNREHDQINFHLTQAMSDHEGYNKFLFKMGKVESPSCSHYNHDLQDGPQYTRFECEAWKRECYRLIQILQKIGEEEEFALDSLVSIMLRSEDAWNRVSSSFVCQVMKKNMHAKWTVSSSNNLQTTSWHPISQHPRTRAVWNKC